MSNTRASSAGLSNADVRPQGTMSSHRGAGKDLLQDASAKPGARLGREEAR